jgi:hypothetical protein
VLQRTEGCKDQLLISEAILQDCKGTKKAYQKAGPHSCIIRSLELTGIKNKVISFRNKNMNYWRDRTRLHAEGELIATEGIGTQCGALQGNSLPPKLFCISVIPLTEQLNELNTGYEEHTTKTKV